MARFILLGMAVLLSSCSITQNVEPVEITNGSELCVIENLEVRPGFLVELRSVLESKGIAYRMVSETAVPRDCAWTATYLARWTWDLALYMSYAEIRVYHEGSLEGEAIYDSTRGGARMGKFIDAEPKIRELVNELMQYQSDALTRVI